MMDFATPSEVFSWASGLVNLERSPGETRDYKLDRMTALMEVLGKPHLEIPSIHVAGSKGKGSCSSMIASALDALGFSTGVFQSPHVLDWRERLRSAKGFFDDSIYCQEASRLRSIIEELQTTGGWTFGWPTTFEVLTALAHLVFKAAKVDIAVFEVGLGGRLDATNLIVPLASVITHLELEHTDILGPTLSHIAFEKAGIMKPGVPVFTYTQKPEAEKVLRERAQALSCPLTVLERPVRNTSEGFVRTCLDGTDRTFTLGALGTHQADNAALALACLDALRPALAKDSDAFWPMVQTGLNRTLQPGRSTILTKAGQWILADGAHTPDSIASLLVVYKTLADKGTQPSAPVVLCGLIEGKLYDEIARELVRVAAEVIITRPGTFKQSDPPAVHGAFARAAVQAGLVHKPELEVDEGLALERALELARTQTVPLLVCGSFHLLGIILPILLERGWKMSTSRDELEGFFQCQ